MSVGELIELMARAAVIGVAAAALMDVWGAFARRALNVQGLDYALLGRWIGHIRRGRLRHTRIASAEPVRGERAIGLAAHYGIGIAFAVPLLMIWGLEWARAPTLWQPIVIGLVTVLAPWLVMQPAMGAGIAGSRSPRPSLTRVRNLATHTVYGFGLFLAAVVLSIVWP